MILRVNVRKEGGKKVGHTVKIIYFIVHIPFKGTIAFSQYICKTVIKMKKTSFAVDMAPKMYPMSISAEFMRLFVVSL